MVRMVRLPQRLPPLTPAVLGGGRGLPGASAHTPAGHTVQVSKYKIFARPEVGVRRG